MQIGARQRQAGAQQRVFELGVRPNRPSSIRREGREVVEKETVSGDVKNERRVYALEGCLGGLPACKNAASGNWVRMASASSAVPGRGAK
jgi:hypothetical protein